MPHRGLRHISLKARDLEETVDFYTRLLGLEVAFRAPPKRVFVATPGGGDLVDFVKSREKLGPRQGLDHFGLKVTARGLKKIERRLKENSIYFRDPNGYRVECYCD